MPARNVLAIGPFNEADIWFKAAKALGFEIIVVSPDLEVSSSLQQKLSPFVSEFHRLDYDQVDKIQDLCLQKNIVMTLCLPGPNHVLRSVAEINSRMGFRGLDRASASRCGDKLQFQKLLEDHNLPRPRYTIPMTDAAVAAHDQFPCIVKPSFGAGGVGVHKVDDAVALKSYPVHESNLIQEFTKARYHMGCNCVVKNGELIIMSHNVRDLAEERWGSFFVENVFPSHRPDFLSTNNLTLLRRLVSAIGINNWPLKIEVFLNAEKEIVSFIEVNPRPGGTRSPLAFTKILGFDYALEQIKLVSPFHEANFSTQFKPEARFLIIKNFKFKPGKIKNIRWFLPKANVVSFYSQIKPGDNIPNHWDVSVAQACGELILIGDSPSDLINMARSMESETVIEYAYTDC